MKKNKIYNPLCNPLYNIILYNDEEMIYLNGCIGSCGAEPETIDTTSILDGERTVTTRMSNIVIQALRLQITQAIELDPTMMKRIAKYNKEAEIAKLDERMKSKENDYKDMMKKIEYVKNNYSDLLDFCDNFKELMNNEYKNDEDDYDFDDEVY